MSHALREQLAHSVSTAHKIADAFTDRVRGNAPLTAEDDRTAAEEFDRSRGIDGLDNAELSKLLYKHSQGAPIIKLARRSHDDS